MRAYSVFESGLTAAPGAAERTIVKRGKSLPNKESAPDRDPVQRWLRTDKTGECRQGREAFILTLARHSPVLLLLRNGMHQFALQTAFHIWVYLLMGLPAFIDYISPYLYNAPCLYCKLYQI